MTNNNEYILDYDNYISRLIWLRMMGLMETWNMKT